MTENKRVTDADREFGQWLRERRESRGLSGNALARMAEVPQASVWKIENGQRPVTLVQAMALWKALGIGVHFTESKPVAVPVFGADA